MRTVEENKKLCKEMPYLIPRNIFTDKINDNYDYSYIHGDYELPEGWMHLFLQMCEDIRRPLIDTDYIDEFRFSQIKEKYNTMRCYNFGAPEPVHQIIDKYEYLSQFVCQRCGKPAKYKTGGWIASYCEDCIKLYLKPEYIDECNKLEFNPIMHIHRYNKDGDSDEYIDCSDEWKRLFK